MDNKEKQRHIKNSLSESRDQPNFLSPKTNYDKISPQQFKNNTIRASEETKHKNNTDDKFNIILNILKKHSEERHEKDLLVMMPLINEIAFFKQKNIQGQDLIQICSELKHEFHMEGEAVFRQGEYGDKFYVILRGEVAVKIPDPKKKNELAKQSTKINKQSTILTVKQSVVSQAPQSEAELRRPTYISTNTMKFLPETKNTSSNVFLTNSNEPSPKTVKLTQNIQSLSQYMDQVKSKRRSTINNLNPLQGNKLSVGMHMLIKDNKSHMHNNDIEEGEFEDSDGEENYPPTIKSEDSRSQQNQEDEDQYENQLNQSQESIVPYSVQDQASVIARGIEEDEGFIQVAKLIDGSSFGELALLEQKPRAATIRCLQNSHFMVLTKNDYVKVIGKIERRAYNEKINFLRNIPVFSLLTRTSLGKLTYSFENKSCIRDQLLYKEGDSADYVYIIKSGEFEATKRILHTGPKADKIEDILENPIKANKHKNNLFSKNTLRKIEKINLFILGSGQLIGEEDVCINSVSYQTTVKCLSQHAELIRLKKEDFMRLQSQGPTWNEILKSITEKKKKIQICLLQTRASKNRIESQFHNETLKIREQLKNESAINQLTNDNNEMRHRKSKSNNQTSQQSFDFIKQSQNGMKFQDMMKMFGGGKQSNYQESQDGDNLTQHSLPTIQDNRQIFLSLKQAQLSQSTDRNKMSQTLRFHANQLKTLRPQATLFPQNYQYKMINESQISSDSFSHQYQMANQLSKFPFATINNKQQYVQSDEFSMKSQQDLKMKYRLRRRLEKIGLSYNYQDDQLRNKNPFGYNHEKNVSMNLNNSQLMGTERSLLNRTTVEAPNIQHRNQDDSLKGGDSFTSSQVPKSKKTIILTKTQHVNI